MMGGKYSTLPSTDVEDHKQPASPPPNYTEDPTQLTLPLYNTDRDSGCSQGSQRKKCQCARKRRPRVFWTGITLLSLILFWTLSKGVTMFCRKSSSLHEHGLLGDEQTSSGRTHCPAATIAYKAGDLNYAFKDLKTFRFDQRLSRHGDVPVSGPLIQVAGQVVVKITESRDDKPFTVNLDVHLSHDVLSDAIKVDQEDNGVVFTTDQVSKDVSRQDRPCISVVATIYVSPSVHLDAFDIDTVSLPIVLQESLELTAASLKLRSVSGGVNVATKKLDSRSIEVSTTSGSITGDYPLYDLLSLKSVSGTVNVHVEPEDGQREAKLIIDTRSGSIKVDTADWKGHNRPLSTSVTTVSGTVMGSYPMGGPCHLESTSGSLELELVPSSDIFPRSLSIESTSGSIRAHVRNNSFDIDGMQASFKTKSGTVEAHIPDSWAGDFYLKSMTGSIDVEGKDVKIIKDKRPFPGVGREVEGSKGDGKGHGEIKAETLNGSIKLHL